eukprot:gene25786-11452_t
MPLFPSFQADRAQPNPTFTYAPASLPENDPPPQNQLPLLPNPHRRSPPDRAGAKIRGAAAASHFTSKVMHRPTPHPGPSESLHPSITGLGDVSTPLSNFFPYSEAQWPYPMYTTLLCPEELGSESGLASAAERERKSPEQARLQPSHALQMSSSRAINRLGPNPVLSPRGPAHRGQVSCSAKIGSGAVEAPLISKGSSTKSTKGGSTKSPKGFSAKSKTSAELFAIEIPVAGEDAASTSELAASVAGQLSSSLNAKFTLVLSGLQVLSGAIWLTGAYRCYLAYRCLQVLSGLQDSGLQVALIEQLIVEVALVEQLIDEVWLGGAPAAVLNSEFPAAPVPAQYKGLSDSILVVWSFLPISLGGILGEEEGAVIQIANVVGAGLMGGKEGAVLRNVNVVGAAAKDATWRIVYRQSGDNYVACGKTKQRPSNNDL